MPASTPCACAKRPRLVLACSGAADVGAVADPAARRLDADGSATMFCLAGVGGRVPGILKTVAGVQGGTLRAALFALGHCLPILAAGSFAGAVGRYLESAAIGRASRFFRRGAGLIGGGMGLYFLLRPWLGD